MRERFGRWMGNESGDYNNKSSVFMFGELAKILKWP